MRYELFEIKTGQRVGWLRPDGTLECESLQHRRELVRVVGRDLLTRAEHDPHNEAFGEVIEEGEMCYLDQRSVTPRDDDYLAVLVRQLPVLTGYEARPVPSE